MCKFCSKLLSSTLTHTRTHTHTRLAGWKDALIAGLLCTTAYWEKAIAVLWWFMENYENISTFYVYINDFPYIYI